MNTTTIIKKVIVIDDEFAIVKKDNYYCAINYKYIDENGKLTKTLNGLQMFANETLEGCVKSTTISVFTDFYIAKGLSLEDAIGEAFRTIKTA